MREASSRYLMESLWNAGAKVKAYDPKANGAIEKGVQDLNARLRAIRIALQYRVGKNPHKAPHIRMGHRACSFRPQQISSWT